MKKNVVKYNYLIGNYIEEGETLQFEYKDEKVKKILCDTKILQRKVGLEIARKVKQRMNQLEAVENFNMYLTKIGLGKPHPLLGDLDKCYAIHITKNYRMVVEPLETELDMESLKKCKILNIKGVLEYHDGKNEWIIP